MEFNPKKFSDIEATENATEQAPILETLSELEKDQETLSIQEQLEMQQQALAQIYKSVEKTRKYFLYSMIGTIVTFVLPLIAFLFALPRIINVYTGGL